MARQKRTSSADKLHKFFEDIPFYIPSGRLVEVYIKRLCALDEVEYVPDNKSLELQRKYLGQQIYLYLATLSKTPESVNGEGVDLAKELNTDYFRKSIGLGDQFSDKILMVPIILEFMDWLSKQEGFRTGWGIIYTSTDSIDKVFLTRNHRVEPCRR